MARQPLDAEARDAAARSDALLRATLGRLPHGLVVIGEPAQRVLEHNRRFVQMFALDAQAAARLAGATAAELVQACAAALVSSDGLEELLRAELTGAESVARRLEVRDGRALEGMAAAIHDDHGRRLGRMLMFEDATERMRAEEERRTLDRRMLEVQRLESLGVLAGGIAHEFNNLLTGIIGSTELVLGTVADGAPTRRQLERVLEASSRAAKLCEEMSATAGQGVVEVRRLHLTDLVHRALQLLQPSTTTRIRVEERLRHDLPPVAADEAQLIRVFENLFLNACEAVDPRAGVVRVSTGASLLEERDFDAMALAARPGAGEYVWFEVEDDGVGMDESTRARMFDPFFSTKFAGRGLGLASAASVVRNHGGAVEVESRPGQGSRIRVLLPRAE